VQERKVIWSFAHAGRPDFDQARTAIDLGAELGIDGIEIETDLEKCLTYDSLPQLRAAVDAPRAEARRDAVRRIAAYAKERGLRVSQWLHDLSGPRPLLDLWPELKAPDGFLDLQSPLVPRLIAARLAEFFSRVPEVDDVTLTMTETQVCVLHRPYSKVPLVDRALWIIQAVADALRPLGKGLIVRPFSALTEDYEAILAAIEKVECENLAVMEKTEPYDWNPFLPDSPFMRKVGNRELRAEADAGAEYYGQSIIPACHPHYLADRLRGAYEKGARTFVLRADRANNPAVGTLNEINIVAATAWVKDPNVDIEAVWRHWLEKRLGAAPEGLAELLEQTFEVIKTALYIDRQQISHNRFPSFEHAKHVQMFHLFEPAANLRHMREHWSMIAERRTRPHDEIVSEKAEALEMARSLSPWFESLAGSLQPEAQQTVRDGLRRLEHLARATLALVRLAAAHLEDVWSAKRRAVGAFEDEARAMLELADEIAASEGPDFFAAMPDRMRSFVEGLRLERSIELPRRAALAREAHLVDYILCGLASEGHKLSKRLHSGSTRCDAQARYRGTGIGEREGLSYEIKLPKNRGFRLEMTLVGTGRPAQAEAWIGPHKFEIRTDAPEGRTQELSWQVAGGAADTPARIEVWSTGSEPCRVSEIRTYEI